mmetsp:Transcript_22122/g.37460  ORF Transcript_22122/g.37460 Transcript_22122/m.37460 type:complete len:536 (-) Transcript_22122:280-1887(-)
MSSMIRQTRLMRSIPRSCAVRRVYVSLYSTNQCHISRTKINKLTASETSNILVKVQGWVRTNRSQKKVTFLQLNDGSNLEGIQAVWTAPSENELGDNSDQFTTDITKMGNGAAVEVIGTVVASQGKKQKCELQIQSIQLVGDCDAASYPLQKKRHSLEYLRTISHLRARTNTIGAVARMRSTLAFAAHSFFQQEGFLYLHTPIITSSDCEGAGEMFRVTTLPVGCSTNSDSSGDSDSYRDDTEGGNDVVAASKSKLLTDEDDFFGKPTFLTVSGQLTAESYACSIGDVYTFGPTFRAENSNTGRHLAEFQMIEPEMAFSDLTAVMDNAEAFVKHVVAVTMEQREEDFTFFNQFYDKTLKQRMEFLVNQPFIRVSYQEAIKLLQDEIKKDPSKWQFPHVEFGTDLANEHEKWLCENTVHGKACVFVYDYPKAIKSFYMRDNDDEETVACFDLLVPGVGELIGGAQREERLDLLTAKIKEKNMAVEDYQWYLDSRRFGSVPHGGYGVGFERLVCLMTAMDNIRDAVAFPRVPGNAFP